MNNPATRLRILLVSVALPLVLVAVHALLATTWLPELPAEVVVHWGPTGADAFGDPRMLVFLPLAIVVPFAAIACAASWRPAASGRPTMTQKILLAMVPAIAGLLAVGVGSSLWIQRGLEDLADVPSVLPWMVAGFGTGAVLFVVAWLILPRADRSPMRGERAEPLPIPSTTSAYWSRTVALSAPVWVLIGSVLALAGGVVALVAVVEPAAIGLGIGVILLVAVGALLTGAWRVTADRRGLSVRGILGVPVFHVPADDIADVRLVDVQPTGDFGGWGVRFASGGRVGVILRAGQAIEVVRRNGRSLTVTVADAATGAAVLAALRAPLR